MRSSYEQAFETLTAATFVCEAGSQWKITFHEDSTVEYDCDGEFYSGTWWFEDAYTVNYEFDGGNDETDDETKKKKHRLLSASGRTADDKYGGRLRKDDH